MTSPQVNGAVHLLIDLSLQPSLLLPSNTSRDRAIYAFHTGLSSPSKLYDVDLGCDGLWYMLLGVI